MFQEADLDGSGTLDLGEVSLVKSVCVTKLLNCSSHVLPIQSVSSHDQDPRR